MQIKTGILHIYSDPPGADIYINDIPIKDDLGNIVKTYAIITDIPEGSYRITLKKTGYYNDVINTNIVGNYESNVFGVLFPMPIIRYPSA